MPVREDKMGQTQLLPTSLREHIRDDHICHLVIAVVNGLDKEIEKAEEKSPGAECRYCKAGFRCIP